MAEALLVDCDSTSFRLVSQVRSGVTGFRWAACRTYKIEPRAVDDPPAPELARLAYLLSDLGQESKAVWHGLIDVPALE